MVVCVCRFSFETDGVLVPFIFRRSSRPPLASGLGLIYTKVLEYHTAYYAHNPMGDIESAVLLEQHHLVAPYTD